MRFSEPCFANGFEWCEVRQGLQTSTEIVGSGEVGEVLPELVVAVVVVAFDRRVHSLDLTVGPGMSRLCQPMAYTRFSAGELGRMAKKALVLCLHLLDIVGCPAIAGGIGEVRTIVGEHGVDLSSPVPHPSKANRASFRGGSSAERHGRIPGVAR